MLGELRALSEEGSATKVVDGEDSGAALGGSGLKLGSVNLDKAMLLKGVSEHARDHRSHAEEGLVRGVSKIQNARGHAVAQGLGRLVVAKGEVLSRVDEVNRADVDLNSRVRRRSDGLWGLLEDTRHLNERLGADLAHPLDEVGVIGIAGEDTLDRVRLVSEEEEVKHLGQRSLSLDTGSECDLGADGERVELGDSVDLSRVHRPVGAHAGAAAVERGSAAANGRISIGRTIHARPGRVPVVELDAAVAHVITEDAGGGRVSGW